MLGNNSLDALEVELDQEVLAITNTIADGGYKTFEEYKRAVGYRAGLKKALGLIAERRNPTRPPVSASGQLSAEETLIMGQVQ